MFLFLFYFLCLLPSLKAQCSKSTNLTTMTIYIYHFISICVENYKNRNTSPWNGDGDLLMKDIKSLAASSTLDLDACCRNTFPIIILPP